MPQGQAQGPEDEERQTKYQNFGGQVDGGVGYLPNREKEEFLVREGEENARVDDAREEGEPNPRVEAVRHQFPQAVEEYHAYKNASGNSPCTGGDVAVENELQKLYLAHDAPGGSEDHGHTGDLESRQALLAAATKAVCEEADLEERPGLTGRKVGEFTVQSIGDTWPWERSALWSILTDLRGGTMRFSGNRRTYESPQISLW